MNPHGHYFYPDQNKTKHIKNSPSVSWLAMTVPSSAGPHLGYFFI